MQIGETNSPMLEALTSILDPMLQARGFELVDLEYHRGKQAVIRLFIDRLKGTKGVSIDDCATVSRLLAPALEVEDVVSGAYVLEVSSPGLERRLTKEEHFVRFRGERARLTTHQPVLDRTFFSGIIAEADEASVTINVQDERIEIPYSNVKKANLEFDFGKSES